MTTKTVELLEVSSEVLEEYCAGCLAARECDVCPVGEECLCLSLYRWELAHGLTPSV